MPDCPHYWPRAAKDEFWRAGAFIRASHQSHHLHRCAWSQGAAFAGVSTAWGAHPSWNTWTRQQDERAPRWIPSRFRCIQHRARVRKPTNRAVEGSWLVALENGVYVEEDPQRGVVARVHGLSGLSDRCARWHRILARGLLQRPLRGGGGSTQLNVVWWSHTLLLADIPERRRAASSLLCGYQPGKRQDD